MKTHTPKQLFRLAVSALLWTMVYAGVPPVDNILLNNGAPVRFLVPVDDRLGTNWVRQAFDDSGWTLGASGIGYETNAVGDAKILLADSVLDWSPAGVIGHKSWIYGYYNRTLDADGVYDAQADFNHLDPNWSFLGGVWQLGRPGNPGANPPWTRIAQTGVHPNGTNNGSEQWPIRRWVSTHDGDAAIEFHIRKSNNNGNGITGKILHNGTEVFSRAIAQTNQVGYIARTNLTLAVGDTLDFAQTPIGLNGGTDDGSDSGVMTARIYAGTDTGAAPILRASIGSDVQDVMRGVNGSVYMRFPFVVNNPGDMDELMLNLKWNDGFYAYLNGQLIMQSNVTTDIVGTIHADSIADWSTNPEVISNGWENGYFNFSLDGDATYSDIDFIAFPATNGPPATNNFWTGTIYDWFEGNPPWTQMGQEAAHPNGVNNGHEHWVIRRWHATVAGDLAIRVRARKQNTAPGNDGVGIRVFKNGVEIFQTTVAATDAFGIVEDLPLPGTAIGDRIDVALLPNAHDGSDGSFFSATVYEGTTVPGWSGNAHRPRSFVDTYAPTEIDLGAFIPDLVPGPNVLAVHGMNHQTGDDSFLFAPVLDSNQQPVDGVSARVVYAQGGRISLARMLGGDVDGNLDVLTMLSIQTQSVNGVTLMIEGGEVLYTPNPGFAGSDRLSYTFSDGSGVPVQGTFDLSVSDEIFTLDPVRGSAGDPLLVSFPVIKGFFYRLERTLSLTPPDWMIIAGASATGSGFMQLSDPNPPGVRAYYRVSTP